MHFFFRSHLSVINELVHCLETVQTRTFQAKKNPKKKTIISIWNQKPSYWWAFISFAMQENSHRDIQSHLLANCIPKMWAKFRAHFDSLLFHTHILFVSLWPFGFDMKINLLATLDFINKNHFISIHICIFHTMSEKRSKKKKNLRFFSTHLYEITT